MHSISRWGRVLATVLAIGIAGGARAEEGKVRVLAPWQGEGQLFQIEPGKIMFLGRFDGIMYVENGKSALDGVPFVCPGTQVIDTEQGAMTADGYCMVTPSEEEEVYAKWSCAGQVGVCKGKLEFTGGTGRFEGMTGGGEMTVRTAVSDLTADISRGEVVRTAAGLAVWPELVYRFAEK